MQNIIGSEKFSRENRDPPYPSLLGRECLLLRIGMISDEEVLAPSLNREGWGGSLS
jgi:hypothetical protein